MLAIRGLAPAQETLQSIGAFELLETCPKL